MKIIKIIGALLLTLLVLSLIGWIGDWASYQSFRLFILVDGMKAAVTNFQEATRPLKLLDVFLGFWVIVVFLLGWTGFYETLKIKINQK